MIRVEPGATLLLGEGSSFLTFRVASGGTYEILDIDAGDARRMGRGRKLVETMVAPLPPGSKVWVLTRATNSIAREFYAALGFNRSQTLNDFYPDGGAAVLLRRTL